MTKQTKKDTKSLLVHCDKCKDKAVITLHYGPHKFCEKHFIQFFEDRFRKTIRKYSLFKPREKLLVAYSGGKDSAVVLILLKKFYSKNNEIQAIIIDEGVKGYRNTAIRTAEKNCKEWKINCKVISFKKEFGLTNDEIMPLVLRNPKLGGTCAFCGTLRRNIMNKYAKKLGAKRLVTGHNLDDEVQSIVMNIYNNELNRFVRMGATAGVVEHTGFVKRIKPLYETMEKEVMAYCAFKRIQHSSEECCPYSWTAKRNEYREMLNQFETRFPGTKYSILRFFEGLKPMMIENAKGKTKTIKESDALKECTICGEPTEKEFCMACVQLEKIRNEKENEKNSRKETKKIEKRNTKLTCATTKGYSIK